MSNFKKVGEYELNLEKLTKTTLLVTFISSLVVIVIHYLINPWSHFSIGIFISSFFLVGIYYIILIFLHEICHLIGFIIFCGAPLSSLKIGLDLKSGVAYATTSHFMRNKDIRKALLLPFWLTGFLPFVIAIYYNHLPLSIVSTWLIVGALGDFQMYNKIRKIDSTFYIQDDAEKPKLHFYKKTEHVN